MKEGLRRIHEASMAILEKTGVKFHHHEVTKILKQNGVKICGETAFFTEDQIMRWVGKAPHSFTIYASNPKYDMLIGGDEVNYGPGYGAPMIIGSNGITRRALLQDYVQFLKLFQQSNHFKINGGVLVQPSELSPLESYPMMLYLVLNYSDKCLMGGTGGDTETRIVMDMLEIAFEGKESLRNKPRIITICNSLSPLQFSQETLETLLIYAKYGQPVIITPAAMAGTTGPITLAGTIALANAESLAGVALTQMVREGTPVVFGFGAVAADMKTGSIAIGSPEAALCVRYGAQLAKAYGIPCRGGGTYTDAKYISAQSGCESMMVMLTACQEKMNYIIHSAGILDSFNAMSYEKFIVDLEVIGMVSRFLNGVRINNESLAVDVINQVGPGGEFLSSDHTFQFCRKESWVPDVNIRGSITEENYQKQIMLNITKKKEEMINSYQRLELSKDTQVYLKKYLINQGIDLTIMQNYY